MSKQVEQILSAVVFVMLGIVGVAFLTALVSSQSDTAGVITEGATGFACTLRTAITGTNQCGSGNLKFPNVTIGPGAGGINPNCFTSRNCS